MRSLNKITFINSASTQYATISLDGNVHLIGTQGVGKSTLLRAILFFYNSDKTKLGIPREKKNFDQYYFPFQNSYIIYQVKREDITYCVMAFRSQGRVAFRFFDAAYDKDYFIDETGRAYTSVEQTPAFGREVKYTRIVSNYEEYRNIIYGNNAGLAAEFRKYALLQSKQFQNIPRTIQNVFLNSRLDAAFIKETIIKSLSEEEIKIDLSTYAHNHLRNFETELGDIRIWSLKNKAGKVLVREQAQAVATANRSYVFAQQEKKDHARKLGWYLQNTRTSLPALEARLEKATEAREKTRGRLNQLSQKFKEREVSLRTDIKSISDTLKSIKQKKEEYQALGIDTVLSRVQKKTALEASKQLLEEERTLLTRKFQSIEDRYKSRLSHLQNESAKFQNKHDGEVLRLKEQFYKKKEELEVRFERLFDKIRNDHAQLLSQAQQELKNRESALSQLEIKKATLEHRVFLKAERDQLHEEKEELQNHIQHANQTIETAERDKKLLKEKWELEEEKAQSRHQTHLDELIRVKTDLLQKRAGLLSKLESSKGSLFEWLNSNKPGWETSIGKIVDQDTVLFNANLNPQLAEGVEHLYGVQLDLGGLDQQVKTLEDYRGEAQKLSDAIAEKESQQGQAIGNLEKEKQQLKKKYRAKLNDLKELIDTSRYHLDQHTQKLTQTQNALHDLEQLAIKKKEQALLEVQQEREELLTHKEEADGQLEKLQARQKRELSTRKKELKDLIGQEEVELEGKLTSLEEHHKNQQAQIQERKAAIEKQQHAELEDQGADTDRIMTIDKELEVLKEELAFIASSQELVFSYQKDQRELFDREFEFKNQRSLLRKQLEGEELAFETQQSSLSQKLEKHIIAVKELERNRDLILQDLEKFEEFKSWFGFSTIERDLESFSSQDKTTSRGRELIDQIQAKHYLGQEKLDELQEAVTRFTGNFGEQNIFKFPVRFSSNTQYLEFAQELGEFLEEDKISEYESRVNERFAHIVRQVGKETGELQSKEGEIYKVIQKINADFRSRNFVGAIKSMELRIVGSSNKIMQILLEIKKFNDENGMLLGETNLFSSEDQHGQNGRAVKLLKQLLAEINLSRASELKLADSFGLEFRIVENDNDSQWVEKLSNVGSEGTDVLVKAMINIMLLNVFKDSASKKFKDFKLHCMMDEIGRLHPNNVKGILKFANDRNILLINGSPTSYNATEYRYTYILSKNQQNYTTVKRLVQKVPEAKALE